MTLSIFPYVGGKSELAQWIIDHLPDHSCYVEPFAGSASVLVNKPRSKVEVLNDLDGDVVQFFEVCRDHGDKLAEFVRDVPYSRELYNRWADEFYNGKRVDDPIERAGRWVFLRYTSFGGIYGTKSGFKRASHLNKRGPAKIWQQVPDRVKVCRDRFRGVNIECIDALELIERYDGPETVFYCDPPYADIETDYYATGEFGHGEFGSVLSGIEGLAIVSYADLPSEFKNGWHIIERDYTRRARRGATGEWNEDSIERICLNFDPDSVSKFVDANHRQETLAVTDASGGDH